MMPMLRNKDDSEILSICLYKPKSIFKKGIIMVAALHRKSTSAIPEDAYTDANFPREYRVVNIENANFQRTFMAALLQNLKMAKNIIVHPI
jgi:hypothetical protein